MEIDRYYKKITESLKLILLTFEEHKKCLPTFVDIPFEVLDTFENAFYLLPQLLEASKIYCVVIPNLLRIHNLINLNIYNNDFDSISYDELYNSEEWCTMKKLAKEALITLNEPLEKPSNNYF
ncbi:hypothetical protein [Chishuiella changwenlii]|uniref:hypothetical protein n=1 Tax=Chishuiella changwenlii TaxID=1434701 RepID=UPI002FDADA78